jgi:hypothetical protein
MTSHGQLVGSPTPSGQVALLEPTGEPGLGRRGWLAVGLITLVTALLMLPTIGTKSLWRDEGFSVSTVLRPWGEFVQLLRDAESNAAVHSVLLWLWSHLGTSEGAFRTLSALAVLASIPLVALVAQKLADRRVAIVAALLLACHGGVFSYGQMIRAYSFVVLFALASTLFLALDVRRPRTSMLVGWVAASLLLTYSNLLAVTLIVCQVASLFALPPDQRQWKRRLLAGGIVVALTSPLALLIASHNEGGLFEFGLGMLWDVLMVLTGRSGAVGIAAMAVLGVLAIRATLRVYRHGGSPFERWVHALCLAWVAGPLLLALLPSLVQPILTGRYMIISVPGIAVYGAIGVVDLLQSYVTADAKGRVVRLVAVTVVAVGSLAGVTVWLIGWEVENWRGASRSVFAEARSGDEVLFANDTVRLFFEYYRENGDTFPTTSPTPAFPPQPWGDYETGEQEYASFDRSDVEEVAQRADRIWVVIGRGHVGDSDVDEALTALSPTFQLASAREFNGDIDVLLFERRA